MTCRDCSCITSVLAQPDEWSTMFATAPAELPGPGLEERIERIFEELVDLGHKKNADYSAHGDHANLYVSEQFGIPAWLGVLIRMGDKWERIVSLTPKVLEQETPHFESFEDTLRDLANYSVICLALREEEVVDGMA